MYFVISTLILFLLIQFSIIRNEGNVFLLLTPFLLYFLLSCTIRTFFYRKKTLLLKEQINKLIAILKGKGISEKEIYYKSDLEKNTVDIFPNNVL